MGHTAKQNNALPLNIEACNFVASLLQAGQRSNIAQEEGEPGDAEAIAMSFFAVGLVCSYKSTS